MSIKRKTPSFGFNIPNFDAPAWHRELAENFDAVDAILASIGILAAKGVYTNSTQYIVGDRVIDVNDNKIYRCMVGHISPPTGSFAQYRTNNPTHWATLTNTFNERGAWQLGQQYYSGDIVRYLNAVYQATITHISTNQFQPENFALVIDMTEIFAARDQALAAAAEARQAIVDVGLFDASLYYTKTVSDARFRSFTASTYIPEILVAAVDLNTLKNPGVYVNLGVADSNLPDSNTQRKYLIEVKTPSPTDNTRGVQYLIAYNTATNVDELEYVRYWNGGTWSAWAKKRTTEPNLDARYKIGYAFHAVGTAASNSGFGTSVSLPASTIWEAATGAKFAATQHNLGNCYNGTNRFTAVKAGTYKFYAGWRRLMTTSGLGTMLIQKNGSVDIAYHKLTASSGHNIEALPIFVEGICRLEVGDYIQIQLIAASAVFIATANDPSHYFGGHAIVTDN